MFESNHITKQKFSVIGAWLPEVLIRDLQFVNSASKGMLRGLKVTPCLPLQNGGNHSVYLRFCVRIK